MESSISISVTTQTMAFFETLLAILPARSVSDRTCFRRVAQWLGDNVRAGRFNDEIFGRVLLLARESAVGYAKNPRAVFMSNLRKELDYGK